MQVVDVPNERSLHRRVVPRGGGIAIVVVFLGYQITFLNSFSTDGFEVAAQEQSSALVWLICGLLFGAMGGLDDLKPRSVTWRLAGQVLLATLFTWFCLPNQFFIYAAFFACISFLIIFIVNVFNFLDGADGYASSQAILFIFGYLFLGWSDLPLELLALSSVLAGAILGFFLFNFHPARIFLGDLGSYFIGFQLVAISIFGTLDGMSIYIPLILLAPFICDGLLTLVKRLIKKEKWWSAHRDHAYQRLVLNGMGVRTLNVWLVTVNLGVCWPAAWLVAQDTINSIWGIGCVYTFLGIIWYYAPKIDKKSTSHSSDPFLN
jgi:UDP-N-acetylmuramyl pentapeptide phosphotransferase/UDP-N-acetylglucosamine-1-phosphate transferase